MDWRRNLCACWDVVQASLTPLSKQLSQLREQYLPSFSAQEEVWLGSRRFRMVKLLGEGGYSFVYQVRELPTHERPQVPERQYALKKVLIAMQEQLEAAQKEIDVMRRLRHPNLMPLLDASISQVAAPDGPRRVAYMLFPLYEAGSLWDLVTSRLQQGTPLPLDELLRIFIQVCAALQAMHSMQPALAHRDVKPQNVLLQRRRGSGGGGGGGGAATPPRQQLGLLRPPGSGKKKENGDGEPAYAALPVGSGGVEEGEQGYLAELELQQLAREDSSEAAATGAGPGAGAGLPAAAEDGEFHVVLMDFGSTRPARVQVFNRLEALAVQEDAEAHCTAPYRPPELWDVPSSCSLDERVDVWAAGCLLYFMLAGGSPFERVLGEAGGSLMLAVVNGRVSWPSEWQNRCPKPFQELVMACLNTDPAKRPFISEIQQGAEELLQRLQEQQKQAS